MEMREMSFEEKASLSSAIDRLCRQPQALTRVVKMVKATAPYLIHQETEELEIDLDRLDSKTLWAWKATVDRWLQASRKAPKKKSMRAVVRAVVSEPAERVEPAGRLEDAGGSSEAETPAETPDYDSVSTVGFRDGGIEFQKHTGSGAAVDDFSDDSLSDSD